VYILKDGKKYAIAGTKDFEDLGLNWRNIKEIPAFQLNSYAQGGTINQSNVASYKQQLLGQPAPLQQISSNTGKPSQAGPQPQVPTMPQQQQPQLGPAIGSPGQSYQLVKADNGPKVYLVKDGVKHHVESPEDVKNLGLDMNKVQIISAKDLNNYSQGEAINIPNVASYRQQISGTPPSQIGTPPPGAPQPQPGPQVAAVGPAGQTSGQLKSEFEDLGKKALAFVAGPPVPANSPGVKATLTEPSSQSYELFKAPGSSTVYYLKDGKKYAIQSAAQFKELGFDWRNIKEKDSSELNKYPSTDQSYDLIKGSGDKVYILKNKTIYPIERAGDFNLMGLKWGDIKPVSDSELNKYKRGENVNKNNAEDYSWQLIGKPIAERLNPLNEVKKFGELGDWKVHTGMTIYSWGKDKKTNKPVVTDEHNGIDVIPSQWYAANHTAVNAPVFAPENGKITYANYEPTKGQLTLYMKGESGYEYRFVHMADNPELIAKYKKNGQVPVEAGFELGKIGDAKQDTWVRPMGVKGAHLHFEVLDKSGNLVDPNNFFTISPK